ncbi:hypothetical protein OG474_23945 [Kribbella sp. NBC_01505]|uniref:hypothetical protein n=1 Tax=Kribbella sp. NBC_01505 TaxID=2903580 RepID=UPI00386A4BCE
MEKYNVGDLVILEYDEAVRKRPGMYFRVGFDSPRFPTNVLEAVAGHALHPAAAVAFATHTLHSTLDILDDRSFTITTLCPQDLSADGYYDSLLTPEWWLLAAAAALSDRGVVEVWSDEVGFRQELAGIRPSSPRQLYDAPAGSGLRVELHLDPAVVGPDFVFPSVQGLDLHGPECDQPARGGAVVFRDLREVTYL